MTKIITGIAGLVGTVALVGATAFAQFSTAVTASNVAFATGTAALQAAFVEDGEYKSVFDLSGLETGTYTPGSEETATFFLKNTGNVPLALSLRLTSASGHWSELKDLMMLRVYPTGEDPTPEYQTFAHWNAQERDLGETIEPSSTGTSWTVDVMLSDTATNTAAAKSVTTNWTLNGVQVEEPTL